MARLNHDIQPDSGQGDGRERLSGFRRVFGFGEDPLWWSFPVAKVGRLRLRAHALLPLWICAELVASLPGNTIGVHQVSAAVGAFTILALLREAGRGWMARALGSGVEHVVAWPLGGLTPVHRPGMRKPVLAEAGGLVVGALLFPILALVAWGVGVGVDGLLFNPLQPRVVAASLRSPEQIILWWTYYANAVLLALNLVLPMFPMDLVRLIHAAATRAAPFRAHERLASLAWFTALALFVVATAAGETRLMALAAFGALATWLEHRRGEFLAHQPPQEYVEPHREPLIRADHEADTPPDHELDEVLAKISRSGMPSLTPHEREVLERETQRRRRG